VPRDARDLGHSVCLARDSHPRVVVEAHADLLSVATVEPFIGIKATLVEATLLLPHVWQVCGVNLAVALSGVGIVILLLRLRLHH
jgi:hypothetical protein